METRQQGAVLFSGILVLIGTLVIIQLWLLTAALEALLARDAGVLLPATLSSLVLFLVNAGLLWYVVSFDRRGQPAPNNRDQREHQADAEPDPAADDRVDPRDRPYADVLHDHGEPSNCRLPIGDCRLTDLGLTNVDARPVDCR